ncbi:MAG: 50S ribosomal protein L23 [Candidatus Chaera renei]|uniref:Large ribosomal subunit protein uL23 n=1 Tax=Candidatus Chaera renei TaxID=2506947 RepID=A0A4Q0AJI4_9BACT|nr:MAG: 50S ribosomal protein L23 [Candidatus Chaera renei]
MSASDLQHHIVPRMSEKAYAASQAGVYVFEVPVRLSKAEIARSVGQLYSVKVAGVRVLNAKGKPVIGRSSRRQRGSLTYRSGLKKAYVSLAEGQSIKLFAQEETK